MAHLPLSNLIVIGRCRYTGTELFAARLLDGQAAVQHALTNAKQM